MSGFSRAIKFCCCPTPTAYANRLTALAGVVEEYMQQDPESGHAFIFFGRSRKVVKIL